VSGLATFLLVQFTRTQWRRSYCHVSWCPTLCSTCDTTVGKELTSQAYRFSRSWRSKVAVPLDGHFVFGAESPLGGEYFACRNFQLHGATKEFEQYPDPFSRRQ
jgi:hypothetical protein